MKDGIFGFSRKEVLWFTVFFLVTIIVMTFSVVRLISKYYNHNTESYSEIKKHSHSLWNLQDITLSAVNVQRGSLNLIIYYENSKEIEAVKASIQKNRDSLSSKLLQLDNEATLEKQLRSNIMKAGFAYLDLNTVFIKMVNDSVKKTTATDYNVNIMRPALRKFTDLTRETGKLISEKIQKITDGGPYIFHQYEFWLLAIVLLPYFYFFMRFLYLVIKMILWDIAA